MEIFIAIWVLMGIASAFIANAKGRSGCGWLILSAIFGPLALLFIATASSDPKTMERKEARAGLQTGKMRKCPACAEVIMSAATRCKHCGADVEPLPEPKGLFAKITSKRD
jgi:hypothetical protein